MAEHMAPGNRAGVPGGLIAGLILALPLIAIMYAGWRLAGLPFVPFDVFDWMARALPGSLVRFGIDAIVAVVGWADLGPTDESAKAAEQALAVAGLLVAAAVAGGIFFAILDAVGGRHAAALAAALGAATAVPAAAASLAVGQTAAASPTAGATWVLAAFAAWGAVLGWSYKRMSKPTPAEVVRIDRRSFLLRLGGASAVVTVAGAVVGNVATAPQRRRTAERGARWSAGHALPNAGADVQPAPGTRPEFTPLESHYRIDINTIPPRVEEDRWRLRVGGLVEKPLELTLGDLQSRYEPMHQFITLSCISNPVAGDLTGTTRWTGVSLRRLADDWGLQPKATHLKISSADGFFEVVPLDVARADERVMLAYAWDGVPLPTEHGFPLRVYVPDVYGMKQPKWIESIEATDRWEPGYWVERGWDRRARMKATSVIDTVAVDAVKSVAGGRRLVPVGGIAHAGARGISMVEVRVDEGEWRQARLRAPLSGLTWVVWRYDWPFEEGRHSFTVRCFEGDGTAQVARQSSVWPDGATGLHTRSVRL